METKATYILQMAKKNLFLLSGNAASERPIMNLLIQKDKALYTACHNVMRLIKGHVQI